MGYPTHSLWGPEESDMSEHEHLTVFTFLKAHLSRHSRTGSKGLIGIWGRNSSVVATSVCSTGVSHHLPKLLVWLTKFPTYGHLSLTPPPVLFSSELGTVGLYSKYLFVV